MGPAVAAVLWVKPLPLGARQAHLSGDGRMIAVRAIGRQALFAFDPETAHGLSIAALKTGLRPVRRADADAAPASSVSGLDFANPLGMAAGYDKNAEVPDALLTLGFGFTEIGTVTPLPQPGNPRPRIFRLTEDEAVINRLGFNNEGHEARIERLLARAARRHRRRQHRRQQGQRRPHRRLRERRGRFAPSPAI